MKKQFSYDELLEVVLDDGTAQDTELSDRIYYMEYHHGATSLEIRTNEDSSSLPICTWVQHEKWMKNAERERLVRAKHKRLSVHCETYVKSADNCIVAICRRKEVLSITHVPLIWLLEHPAPKEALNVDEITKQEASYRVEGAFASKNCIFRDQVGRPVAKLMRKKPYSKHFELHMAANLNVTLFLGIFLALQKMLADYTA